MSDVKKFIIKEVDGEEVAVLNPEYEKDIEHKKYMLHLNKSGIPPFYWNINFDDYKGNQESKEFRMVKHYASNLKNEKMNHVHLYMYGVNSSQKTALAVNILKEGIKQGLNVKFILAGTLIDYFMKVQGFKYDEGILTSIRDLKKCDVLCIDDAFDPDKSLMWKNSDNKNMIISEWDTFLREIISSNTKLILTSNFTLDVIEQYYSHSLFELVERNCAIIQFTESIKDVRKSIVADVFKDFK